MRIVIVGCGRVGAQLAMMLDTEGHEVAVVDRDPLSAQRLSQAFGGRFVQGVGFDRDALTEAGINHADGFAAVTSGDNTNIVAALAARDHFHVPRVVARIADPRRAEIYRQFGIPTISPTTWGATQIKVALCYSGLTGIVSLGSGEVEIVNLDVPPLLDGKPASSLQVPGEILLTALVRNGKAMIPSEDAILATHDTLRLAVASSALGKLAQLAGLSQEAVPNR
jgi:trk system potassium uptake protein TrkA